MSTTTKRSLLCLMILCCSLCTAQAESIVSGSSGVNGKTINYKFVGDKSATASSSFIDDVAEINAQVDGVKHHIQLNMNQLKWNKKKVTLKNFSKIDISIDRTRVTIKADGKVVISSP